MSGLVHLIYSSAATREMSSDDLVALLELARKKNASLDITGMLLFVEGSFLQVLEGDGDAVDALFDRIAGDKRHSSVVTIIREPILRRDFTEWSMGYAQVTADELASIDGLNDFFSGQRCFDDLNPGRTKKLLKAFNSGRWRSRVESRPAESAPSAESAQSMAPTERPSVSYAFQPIVDLDEQRVTSHEAIEYDKASERPTTTRRGDPATRTHPQMESHTMAFGLAARLGLATDLTLNYAVYRCDDVERTMQATVDAAERYGFSPERLTLELDHDQLLDDPQWFASVLQKQRAFGMRISIDNFGAGRSSHYLIDTYQPDGVSLNEGLVRHIESNGARQAIVRGILQTAEDLGIDVVAKQVRDQAEVDWFRSEGVHLFQGAFFAEPQFEQLASDVLILQQEHA